MFGDCSFRGNLVGGGGGARKEEQDGVIGEGEGDYVWGGEEGCEGEDGCVPCCELGCVGCVEDCFDDLAKLGWHCGVDFAVSYLVFW